MWRSSFWLGEELVVAIVLEDYISLRQDSHLLASASASLPSWIFNSNLYCPLIYSSVLPAKVDESLGINLASLSSRWTVPSNYVGDGLLGVWGHCRTKAGASRSRSTRFRRRARSWAICVRGSRPPRRWEVRLALGKGRQAVRVPGDGGLKWNIDARPPEVHQLAWAYCRLVWNGGGGLEGWMWRRGCGCPKGTNIECGHTVRPGLLFSWTVTACQWISIRWAIRWARPGNSMYIERVLWLCLSLHVYTQGWLPLHLLTSSFATH